MLREHVLNETTWIDLERPTREEVLSLVESFGVPLSAAEELAQPSVRSKVDPYPALLYLVFHFPIATPQGIEEREVDFIIGRNFLITARYSPNPTLERFAATFDLRSVANPDQAIHGGHLFFWVLRALYKSLVSDIESSTRQIRKIEQHIFSGNETPMVREISHANRLLLDLKQPLGFHGDILRSFETHSADLFGPGFLSYSRLLLSEQYRIEWMLGNARSTLHDLRDTNDSLLAAKNNDIIQKLTIMSFVMLPLALIASIFGMNASMPLVESKFGFWLILGVMALAGIALFVYFKSKRWF